MRVQVPPPAPQNQVLTGVYHSILCSSVVRPSWPIGLIQLELNGTTFLGMFHPGRHFQFRAPSAGEQGSCGAVGRAVSDSLTPGDSTLRCPGSERQIHAKERAKLIELGKSDTIVLRA